MVEERVRNSVLKGGSPTEETFEGKCFPIPLRLSMKMFYLVTLFNSFSTDGD